LFQAFGPQLEEVLGPLEVAQAMLAQVDQVEVLVSGELDHRNRQHHLTPWATDMIREARLTTGPK
jgi:hypothetical protein